MGAATWQGGGAAQARRLISIAAAWEDEDRTAAAKIGVMGRRRLCEWVHRFNAEGRQGVIARKPAGDGVANAPGAGLRDGMTSEVRDRLKALERENRELRQANEILKAPAYFAQAELDRRFKP
jgi:transposase-like protein